MSEQWDGEPIPLERWGKDHWSTFAYAETRIVDYDGFLDCRHMRGHLPGWDKYATRLNDGGETVELFGHNDYDCISDAFDAGLLVPSDESESTREWRRRSKMDLSYRVQLTDLGRVVAGKLRAHKGSGGVFHTFDPGPTAGWWAAARKEKV